MKNLESTQGLFRFPLNLVAYGSTRAYIHLFMTEKQSLTLLILQDFPDYTFQAGGR
jgi:hypothetical protein